MDDLVQSAFTFLNPRLFVEFTFVSKCIWCLYNKQKKRWFPVDMEFPFPINILVNLEAYPQLEECIYQRRPNCQCVKDLGTSRTCEDM